ncbi:HNH endonuclease signature motif containing protein [Actinomycetospora sp. CA-053990]|uniref:HNH endonuclease signature motif containing protein n=1 Tax=Actinomycetospora sp. CA-053990 TaxID=3239891 RepID=UPI003D8C82C1
MPALPADPAQALETQRGADAGAAESLVGSWAPQLSAKKPGLVVDGQTYDAATILTDHQRLRGQQPDAILVWSGDFTSFRSRDFWITLANRPFSTSDAVNAWCQSAGFGPDDCYAKRLSHTGGYAENTAMRTGAGTTGGGTTGGSPAAGATPVLGDAADSSLSGVGSRIEHMSERELGVVEREALERARLGEIARRREAFARLEQVAELEQLGVAERSGIAPRHGCCRRCGSSRRSWRSGWSRRPRTSVHARRSRGSSYRRGCRAHPPWRPRARSASDAIRRALNVRDGGCAFPGCSRRPRRCQAHHVDHWLDGGDTALDNMCLLCRFHHQLIHHGHWSVQIIDGRPWFTPPEFLDPERQPRPGGRPRVPP